MTPAYAHEYASLAFVARRIAEDRAAGDPAFVAAGRLTQAQADDRARVAAALAREWQAVADCRPAPDRQATEDEMQAVLTGARDAWTRRADAAHADLLARSPGLTGRDDHQLAAEFDPGGEIAAMLRTRATAACCNAMLWWHGEGMAHLHFLRALTRAYRTLPAASQRQVA